MSEQDVYFVVWQCPECSNVNYDRWLDRYCQCGKCGVWYEDIDRYVICDTSDEVDGDGDDD